MKKADFIKAVAKKAGITNTDATMAVEAFTEVVADSLKKGDSIQLIGFGTFEISERAAREGRNPQTGEPIMIKASKTVKFKAGKALKDALN